MSILVSKPQPDITVIEPTERLDSTAAPRLEAAVKDALSGGGSIVVDLARTPYIASMALRALLLAAKGTAAKGTRFAVATDDARILQVLQVAGFTSVMTIVKDRQAALALLRQ